MNARAGGVFSESTFDSKTGVSATSSNSARGRKGKPGTGKRPNPKDGSEQKMQRTDNKKNFYCKVCDVFCTCQNALDDHLAGRRHHKKILEMRVKNGARIPQVPADIQVDLLALSKTEPLVGLEYITEHQKDNNNHRYFCELCDFKCGYNVIMDHVISRRHRLRFMRTHFLDFYKEVTGYPTFKGVMEPHEADVFLRRQSAFIVKTILKGVLKPIKTVPYSRDCDMKLNIESFVARGLVHPSRQRDMARAEMLLEATDEHSPDFHNIVTSSLLDQANTLERHIRAERSTRLIQQEGRVLNALKKLQEGSMGLGMTREELIAYEKLQALLKNIRAEKNLNLLNDFEEDIGSILEPPGVSGTEFRPRPQVPRQKMLPSAPTRIRPLLGRGGLRRPPPRKIPNTVIPPPSQDHELDDRWGSGEQAELPSENSGPTMSEIRKVVEPLIEKTRQEVEKKILEALNSDRSLSLLTEKFKNNPDLSATLKQWEEKHSSSSPSTSGFFNQANNDDLTQDDGPPHPLVNILKRPFGANSPGASRAYSGASDNNLPVLPFDNSPLGEPAWGNNRGQTVRGGRLGQFSDGFSRLHRLAGDGASSHHSLEFNGPRPKIKRSLGSRPQFSGGTGRFGPF